MSFPTDAVVERLQAAGLTVPVERELDLSALTTYRVGGAARVGLLGVGRFDLDAIAPVVRDLGVETLVIGRGSNLLVADAGFDGLAFTLGDEFGVFSVDQRTVRAGGALALPALARRLVAHRLTNFEWAVGVPGSIGGAVRMNAGGHGADMATSLLRVEIVDLATGESASVDAAELDLAYRRSNVVSTDVVTWAELELDEGDPDHIEAELRAIVRWRRDNQPGGQNAGSVFTNPPDDSAGRLIDSVGLKGFRIGSAEVSPKHANFIQADPGGSADDIWALMGEVRHRVADAAGFDLVAETRTVGFGPAETPSATRPDTPTGDRP